MKKYHIYLHTSTDEKGGEYTERHYYSGEVEQRDNLKLIGIAELDDMYFFQSAQTKVYNGKEPYTRKEINKAYGELEDGSGVKGMIGEYYRLMFSYIPQLLEHFEPDLGGYYTPHRSKFVGDKNNKS